MAVTRGNLKFWAVLIVSLCLSVMIIVVKRNVSSSAMISESHSVIRLTQDSLYAMYGEGDFSEYDEHLLNYIRSQMSRQSPGGLHLSDPSRPDYSQFGAPPFVDRILKKRQNGFFVECGALDGERFSDTLYFEMKRNWTGLLIEAHPKHHRDILKKNRRALVLWGCLYTVRRPAMVNFKLDGVYSGISAHNIHSKKYEKEPVSETYVECFSLNSVMAAIGVHHVDYMVLDVEGAELSVLETIDFTRLSFDVLSIEYSGNASRLNCLRQFFNRICCYKEVGKVPERAKDSKGHDVVLMRV